MKTLATPEGPSFQNSKKFRLFGADMDRLIQIFFAGNAWVAIIVLLLITLSLFREGAGFFPQHHRNLTIYRQAGLEYVDIVRDQADALTSIKLYLDRTRNARQEALKKQGMSPDEINRLIAPYLAYSLAIDEAGTPLGDLISEMTAMATDIKDRWQIAEDLTQAKKLLLDKGMKEEAAALEIENVDLAVESARLKEFGPRHREITGELGKKLLAIAADPPRVEDATLGAALEKSRNALIRYVGGFPEVEKRKEAWDGNKPVPFYESFTKFIFGPKWVTQSFWQDWYGFLPLLFGSLSIGCVAVVVAVPFGVGAAIYVNQIAWAREQQLIKPYIEFISAIPSVVLGFFGIAVLGESIRLLSQQEWMSWVPFFPISERLNIMTAGLLLALMAIPTIFTLSEDALNNVPQAYKEASFALGANRLQTIAKIMVPASLSGIISAILLGFGRVIGETMVVLLCAGNRIGVPDFSEGLGFVFQPVHTMTGLVAQEIPEVVKGSLQYRALFMLAIALFIISLAINYVAQQVVKKFKISIG
jgi:phosphate transport system permease protein